MPPFKQLVAPLAGPTTTVDPLWPPEAVQFWDVFRVTHRADRQAKGSSGEVRYKVMVREAAGMPLRVLVQCWAGDNWVLSGYLFVQMQPHAHLVGCILPRFLRNESTVLWRRIVLLILILFHLASDCSSRGDYLHYTPHVCRCRCWGCETQPEHLPAAKAVPR